MDELTPDAWHAILADYSYGECEQALAALAGHQAFIAPSEVAAEVRRARHELAELDRAREMFARLHQPVRGGAPPQDWLDERERLGMPSQSHLLTVGCPWCGALPGERCQVPGNSGLYRRPHEARPAAE